ncbi:hypothetical protein [Frigoribacterium sp. SL97]|uniref:hypothetical protein n=1 Tax=Frigoribacterium sp. SL97 TaxID=2994664 RepID=UPI0022717C1A|nr:hypothetical protein [Frigoribacterium sp. SL97]WAC50236.1 hypothetical protein OVA02_10075 [Frigoribacterium sp. SL97]
MAKPPRVGNTAAGATPDFPTMVKKRYTDGRIVGIDNSVWLYRSVPLSPVSEARTAQDAVAAGGAIQGAINELSRMTKLRNKQRALNQKSYRQVHLLLSNVPTYFKTPIDNPIRDYLDSEHVGLTTYNRVLLFGVRLTPQLGDGTLRSAWESAVESLASGGTPMSDFDADFKAVDTILTRAGLTKPSSTDFRYANAWWNYGANADVPYTYHDEHVHYFSSSATARIAEEIDINDCSGWRDMDGTHAITFSAVESFELPYVSATEDAGRWASRLVESDALAISIRGLVEPPVVTREVMRKQIVNYRAELTERQEKNKLDRAELDEKLGELDNVERAYAGSNGNAPATLIETSTIVALRGIVEDVNDTGAYQLQMSAMQNRQPGAWAEMMVASSIRANPYLEDLPSSTIAYSGLPSLSNVGDRTGALFGLTERDRQPVWLSPVAVADEDTPPVFLVAAGSGSGKTMLLLNLADQQARVGIPNVIIDPKVGSDHSPSVLASGGQVISLDDLTSSDGALDALRFAASPAVGVDMAASAIITVNPWGPDVHKYEVPLYTAIGRGVELGATCTGQALQLAYEDETNEKYKAQLKEMIDPLFRIAGTSALFRSFFGINPQSRGLRVADGTTLIKVGDYRLELPSPDTPREAMSFPQRMAVATVKMMFTGAGLALTGRDGVIHQDEAWVVTGTTPEEAERAGRLARSQRFLPIFYSQDLTGAIDSKLVNHVSRVAIGPLDDEVQARAALTIAKLEATPERLGRITARKSMGSTGEDVAPNWNSLRPLYEPGTRNNLRGTVFITSDLAGRAVPVEVKLSPGFLKRASTNRLDLDAWNLQTLAAE